MTRTSVRRLALCTLAVLTACCAFHPPVRAAEKNKPVQPSGTLTKGMYRPFLINAIFNYYANNGDGSYNPFSFNNEGFEFPKGSGLWTIFEDGMLWGGLHKGSISPKIGGSAYRHALQAGPLLTSGTPTTTPVPADRTDPKYRMYRVRPDVRPDLPFNAVEALLTAEEIPYVSRYETVTAHGLYDRYIADWNGWPATDGAPFTDVDENGVYDPAVDIPGQPGADQTLWYVANDMNDSLTQNLAGSPAIGLEVQRTIWGYRRGGALGNVIFTNTVLINKSGAPVDSMYLTQWSDPDLGYPGDDLAGCDTTLDLSYVYNGQTPDAYAGTTVPAGGFTFIQGPMVPGAANDTAFFLGSRRPGFKNLGMTTFAYFTSGLVGFVDPVSGPNGCIQWYRLMRGTRAFDGTPFIDPNTSQPTPFCAAGDPVKATNGTAGWVDGQAGTSMMDRRFCMSTGPFTLANGDTQQVIVASIASRGTDRLSSVAALRSDVRAVRHAWHNLALGRRMPPLSCDVTGDSAQAAITLRIAVQPASITSASINLATFRGMPVATVTLADDGVHDDGVAGDGVWGGTVRVPVQRAGLQGGATITFAGGETITWDNVLDHIATTPLTVASFALASDNINSNGVANPGENVRYTFALRNESVLDLPNLVTTASPIAGNGKYAVGTLASHALFQRPYNAADPSSWFVFDVPAAYQDSTFSVAIVTTDDSANIWRDTLIFPVKAPPGQVYGTPLHHVSGMASGTYTIQIIDPARVKDHRYILTGADSAGTAGAFTLKDSTTGVVLLDHHPLPDPLGHTSPVVDGFKVLKGTIDVNPGMKSWAVPQGVLRFSPTGGFKGTGLEGFSAAGDPAAYEVSLGTIGAVGHLIFGGIGTTLSMADYHTVLLKLAAVDTTTLWDPKAVPADVHFSKGYRYLRAVGTSSVPARPEFAPWIVNKAAGYPYQDYNYGVPFSAWDMDVDPPMRLAVGHFENNVLDGNVDGRYWPGDTTINNSARREFAFIFNAPYTDMPDPKLAVNLSNNASTPLMWVMTCARSAEVPWVPEDQFQINAFHYPSRADVWVFNPSVVAGVKNAGQPTSFALMQNYPNPFNPSTTIRYELPAQGMVTITVFDILGRAVRHLVRDVQPAGSHAILWHGENDAGISVASGAYFYRCTVEQLDRRGQFDQAMKMVLIR
jgi:hypothetical protein